MKHQLGTGKQHKTDEINDHHILVRFQQTADERLRLRPEEPTTPAHETRIKAQSTKQSRQTQKRPYLLEMIGTSSRRQSTPE